MAPERIGIGIHRHFTSAGQDPFDSVRWERRDARITNYLTGAVAFEQLGVEVPSGWSVNATNILAQKYFRGTLGTPEREWSLKQVTRRVVDTITEWGRTGGYFVDDDEAEAFRDELTYLIIHQRAAFNSPVWFNIGVKGVPQQASACQPYDALVCTEQGLCAIGELVETGAVGTKVYDANGLTKIVAVKANGRKSVLRLHTKAGLRLDVTPDHLVWRSSGAGTGSFVQAGLLKPGDQLTWHRTESWGRGQITSSLVAEAALAGWLQADGFVGQYKTGTNRSLTIEAMTVTPAELAWVTEALDIVFPGLHRHEQSVVLQDKRLDCRRTRLYGSVLEPFVERWDLRARRTAMTVPPELFAAPLPVVAAYLRSLFQAEGYVSLRQRSAKVGLDMISEGVVRGIQALLGRFGIFGRVRFKQDRRVDRQGCWSISIQNAGDRRRFADEIGFIDPVKAGKLEASFKIPGRGASVAKRLEIERIETLDEVDVYDIQTESGEYLSSNLRVHNCFILSVDDSMSSILNWYVEEGTIFKGGSGSGINLSRIRSSKEGLRGGGTASGPVSFMRGADASAGTIKSGGKTRRAAKMVILNVDHPDIEAFIWCKTIEERKARALRDAGFDMDLDGKDSHSIQYQNANNSVRVTDDFMEAVLADDDWHLKSVTTGETLQTVKARALFRQISKAAWECADPGMQFDTTINRWHTAPNTGRINGSNPCFPGDALVHTDKGLIAFKELFARANDGEQFAVYTHDATNTEFPSQQVELTTPGALMITGTNEIVKLRFDNGMELRCTPNHRLFTTNRGYVEAGALTAEDSVKVLDVAAPAVSADLALPVSTDPATYRQIGDHRRPIQLPEKWSAELAHYLGWLVGEDSATGDQTLAAVYRSAEDQEFVLPRHSELVTWLNGGTTPKLSVQANGTVQQRISRRQAVGFFRALGLRAAKAPAKSVPWSIMQVPPEIAAAFLQGLFDADGCVRRDDQKGSYIGLGSSSRELLVGVQRLLTTFGIGARIYRRGADGESTFGYKRTRAGAAVTFRNSATFDLRISARSIPEFARQIGFSLPRKSETLGQLVSDRSRGFYQTDRTAHLVDRVEDGFETTYNLSEPRNHSYVVNGLVVRNCSEYMHLDNSACNLASLNLLTFLEEDMSFDVEGFRSATEAVFTAQEILVGNADYPTEAIAETSRRFRQLGIGYANLGALLMAQGVPYDSDEGRAWAATITALLTGHAYATSARTAARMGPFAGFTENREAMLNVLRMHRDEVAAIDEELVPTELLGAAQEAWDTAVEVGDQYGVRNSQASVLAPTGTIGLLMDCDTTGIEPDLGLVKTKKLVGGGTMSIVNQTVPRALRKLGYRPAEVDAIIAYIDEHKSIIGAPALKAEHLPVFACSMGDNTIHYRGHVRMMGAVQPFISGAISKCVTGETLLSTAEGLVRIGSLYRGEQPDSYRNDVREVASLSGPQKTDAFYYGGVRPVTSVVLRSGHRVTGTANHRLLVSGRDGLEWRRLDEIAIGEYVATQYGDDLWSVLPAQLDRSGTAGQGTAVNGTRTPAEMSGDLAFLLGAYAAAGRVSGAGWAVKINSDVSDVLEQLASVVGRVFGVVASIHRPEGGASVARVEFRSQAIVELFDHLGCGQCAVHKRIPDAVLRSPRDMVLAYLRGLSLAADATMCGTAKWAITAESPGLLDDLQAVLTNLGIIHERALRFAKADGRPYEELFAVGEQAHDLLAMVPFVEPRKAAFAHALQALGSHPNRNGADVVPGISPYELYRLVPRASREDFSYLSDRRAMCVSRRSLEQVAAVAGARLPQWLRTVLEDNLHFSPVESVGSAGEREVFDLSVPATQAFVGNGIVNHNTVNMPEDATVSDVEQLHIEAWQRGLKAVAIYRDNCKVAQPLATTKKRALADPATSEAEAHDAELALKVAELEKALQRQTVVVKQPVRERLPRKRRSMTFKFRVADCEGYVTVGEYDDGRPGEVFMQVSKQGSTLAGIMDAFAVAVSLGLQHGVPLATFVKKYTNMRFEPAGMTDDRELRIASSLVDYIFRRLAVDYLSYEERAELGILTTDERLQPTLPGVEEGTTLSSSIVEEMTEDNYPALRSASGPRPLDAPYCYQCGVQMQRAGSCFACPSCGSTSGCS